MEFITRLLCLSCFLSLSSSLACFVSLLFSLSSLFLCSCVWPCAFWISHSMRALCSLLLCLTHRSSCLFWCVSSCLLFLTLLRSLGMAPSSLFPSVSSTTVVSAERRRLSSSIRSWALHLQWTGHQKAATCAVPSSGMGRTARCG